MVLAVATYSEKPSLATSLPEVLLAVAAYPSALLSNLPLALLPPPSLVQARHTRRQAEARPQARLPPLAQQSCCVARRRCFPMVLVLPLVLALVLPLVLVLVLPLVLSWA